MTDSAADANMLAIKDITSFGVIEAFGCRVPVEQGEVFAIVIGVAFDAGGARRPRARVGGVKPPVLL